jgi:hypothetical protein
LDIGVAYLNFENTLMSISGCRRYYETSREGKEIKKVAALVLLWGGIGVEYLIWGKMLVRRSGRR